MKTKLSATDLLPFVTYSMVLMILSSCEGSQPQSTFSSSTPPPSASNPPLHPGAQQVSSKKGWLFGPTLEITFQTTDKPEDVLQFYKDILVKDGWNLDQDLSTSDFYYFEWHAGNPMARTPAFAFTVETKSVDEDRTDVKLHIQKDLPR